MEIRVLRYFLTVVREESITKASEVLHITQPTLSRQLAQMEEDIGVKLFDRGTRKIKLTNEGILLRRRAEEILQLVDKTEKELVETQLTAKDKEQEIIILPICQWESIIGRSAMQYQNRQHSSHMILLNNMKSYL